MTRIITIVVAKKSERRERERTRRQKKKAEDRRQKAERRQSGCTINSVPLCEFFFFQPRNKLAEWRKREKREKRKRELPYF